MYSVTERTSAVKERLILLCCFKMSYISKLTVAAPFNRLCAIWAFQISSLLFKLASSYPLRDWLVILVDNVICHGIPDENEILEEGGIINVDVSTILDGYFSDASRMFMIGKVSPEMQRLVQVARECLEAGLQAARPWGFLGDIGAAVQEHAEGNGYSVVREFGGHGVGLKFHEDPFVSHVGRRGTGVLLVPGMVFTIEPMINMGSRKIFIDADNDWTVLTDDGMPSAPWEYTVLITDTGAEIITG